MSQYEFATKYNHLRMDTGELIAGLQINTPLDIDVDYGQTGLMFPNMQRNGTVTSLFSGQYRMIKVVNKFSKGAFSQTLSLSRVMSSELLNQTAPSVTGTSQTNQRDSNSTNGGTTSPTTNLPTTNIINNAANSSPNTLLGTNLNGQATLIPSTLQLTTDAGLPVNNTNGVGVQARQ